MKILHIIPYFSMKFGGPVTVLYNLSKELALKGNHITVLTSDYGFDENISKELQSFNIEIIISHTVVNLGLFIYTPSMKSWLEDNVTNYDVIHMHSYRSYQNTVAAHFAIKNNIPYIIQAYGSVLPFFEKKNLKKLYDFISGSHILKNASCVISLCEAETEQYVKMGIPRNKICIVPIGLRVTDYSNLPVKGTFRSKYSIKANEKLILYLGRLHKIKGIDLLIKAYSQLLYDQPNTCLVIAGPDDNYLSHLMKQIQEIKPNIKPLITGQLSHFEKISAFVDADVYVLPSRYETFPNTVLEAWACSTPVIITERCLIADIVKQAGYVTSLSEQELKVAIFNTLNNEIQREKNVKCGRDLIKNRFNINVIVKEMENIYDKIVIKSTSR